MREERRRWNVESPVDCDRERVWGHWQLLQRDQMTSWGTETEKREEKREKEREKKSRGRGRAGKRTGIEGDDGRRVNTYRMMVKRRGMSSDEERENVMVIWGGW